MIILSWNVRRLNNIPRQKVACRLIDSHSPNIIFFQETKLTVDELDSCGPKLWPHGSWQGVGAQGSSGGITCFWNPRKVTPLWWISSKSSISLIASYF